MSHTDKEATELWCPMVRIARDESITTETDRIGNISVVKEERHIIGGCNTDALGRNRVPASCRCIGSKCAMWRWSDRCEYIDGTITSSKGGDPKGYCGLAGKP